MRRAREHSGGRGAETPCSGTPRGSLATAILLRPTSDQWITSQWVFSDHLTIVVGQLRCWYLLDASTPTIHSDIVPHRRRPIAETGCEV